jgi:hypothetical protein
MSAADVVTIEYADGADEFTADEEARLSDGSSVSCFVARATEYCGAWN